MASTYSPKLRFELVGAGEQAGLWGTTTNKNIGQLIEQAIAGVTTIELDGVTGNYTLTALDGTADQSRSAVLKCTYAAVPATGPVNLIIPTQTKLYVVRNDCGQKIYVKTTGQTGGIELKDGEATLVFCDGTNAVAGIATQGVGTLTVSLGGTGATTFTAGFVKSPGGTGALTSSSTVSLSSDVSGTLGVTNGGTGKTTLTTGGVILGAGTSAVTSVVGTVNGQVLSWNGSTWTAAAAPATGVSSFSAGSTGFTPSTATTGAVTLAGKLGTAYGGTNLTSFTSGGAMYATSTSVLTTGTLPVSAGGTGSTTLDGAGIVTKTGTQTISGAKTFSSDVRINLGSSAVSTLYLGPSPWGVQYDYVSPSIGIGYSAGNAMAIVGSSSSTGYAEFTSGTVRKPGGGSFTASSDSRIKDNVVDYTKGLEDIKALRPVNFNYNDETSLGLATKYKTFTGLVAQEVEQTSFISMVSNGDKEYKYIDATELTYALINSVKELSKQVEALKLEVDILKGK